MIAKKGNNTTADFPKEILNVCVKDQMKILEKLHIGKDPKKNPYFICENFPKYTSKLLFPSLSADS